MREPEELATRRALLGRQLAAFRAAAGLTQGQLAKAAHCDRNNVTHIEAGRTRGDEQFRRIADQRCGAGGVLLAAYREVEAAKQSHNLREREADLAEARARATALHSGSTTAALPVQRSWETVDVMRRLHRTEVGWETVEHLHVVVDELCCEYAWRDADELKSDAGQWLAASRRCSTVLAR